MTWKYNKTRILEMFECFCGKKWHRHRRTCIYPAEAKDLPTQRLYTHFASTSGKKPSAPRAYAEGARISQPDYSPPAHTRMWVVGASRTDRD